MRRLIALATALALCVSQLVASPASAILLQSSGGSTATSILLFGQTIGGASATGVRFWPLGIASGAAVSTTRYMAFPISGTITTIRAYAQTAPTSGSWTIGTYVNGVAGLACGTTINSATSGICTGTGSTAVSAGQYLEWRTSPSSPSAVSNMSIVVTFVPTNPGDAVIYGYGSAYSATLTNATYPLSNGASALVGNRRKFVMPESGTFSNLYLDTSAAPGVGKSYTYTLDKNGSNTTGLQVLVSDAATTGNDTTHSFSVAVNDDVELEGAPSAGTPTAPNVSFGAKWAATTRGGFLFGQPGVGTADQASSLMYYPIVGGVNSGSATEANVQLRSEPMTVYGVACSTSVAPGATHQRVYQMRVNGTPQGPICTISGTNTIGTVSGSSVTVNANDLVSIGDDPTGSTGGSATAGQPHVLFAATR